MRKHTILIFAYYSYRDPIFQSAVLPYFINFPDTANFNFVLLTFEQKRYRLEKGERRKIQTFLSQHHINWYNVSWHSGGFKMLKKLYDFGVAFFLSSYILLRHQIAVIYSEAFPGAIISHFLSKLFRKPHIVHSFEPHTEYMVEGGIWTEQSWEARLLKKYEKLVAISAFAIMTATGAMIARLKNDQLSAKLLRVPSCVDTTHFTYDMEARRSVRQQLKIDPDACVVICIGKLGGMYWEEELFEFFKTCLAVSDSFRFLFYTPGDLEKVKSYLDKYGIASDKISIGFLKRDEVPHYLSAADFGLVHVHPFPGKRFCSPIKDGEYWACGLPIIIPRGVSDDFVFAQEKGIGLVLNDVSEVAFKKAAVEMLAIQADPVRKKAMRTCCRQFVELDRDVAVYQQLYRDVFLAAAS